ncbi:hypothetical protein GLOIN_2v1471710 [Rhizophagus irregularis DAOM 181602=DAOM 197198]|uniref:Uncharacterized protein n=1 Tax=Rhizophagus irregularis (strain DAOM 181602 / DAOM 197198 / MUCL 43194) TaxID=747089 RepID=A0A2P4QRE4_RHIID|nr:hypothetical protein GLOIN_2v1471710 [Rhizophagus irregularis DAOM 181602=DAOM 197198]POG80195.1 hypothetical protein GLOIN_2v1471710 [Rhizophagus irregularis DAOM 181602=DAOM 197198]|eukprot:XP_025187061.1 hypothetical protein GLOIN_2v1471710 [Rhizophagus irregularis DAOM 181602=DAOM 197198]
MTPTAKSGAACHEILFLNFISICERTITKFIKVDPKIKLEQNRLWSSNPSELEVLRQHNTELEAKVAELEVFRQRNTELEVEKAKLEEVWRSRVTLQEKKLPSLKTRMRGSGRN